MFDWSQFPDLVVQAGLIVVAVGIGVAAGLQIIKEAIGLFGPVVPAKVMTVLAAVVSAAATVWILVQSGTPWLVAILAALAAFYAPKAAHDAMGKLKKLREAL